MKDAGDFDAIVKRLVEDHVAAEGDAPQAGGQISASATGQGLFRQKPAEFLQPRDQAASVKRTILCDEIRRSQSGRAQRVQRIAAAPYLRDGIPFL